MINAFIHKVSKRVIPLVGKTFDQACQHLISHGINSYEAVKHVEQSFTMYKRNNLALNQAVNRFAHLGYDNYTAHTYIFSDTYDELRFNYPSHYPVNFIRFSSNMRTKALELEISALTQISLDHLADFLIPKGQRIYPPKTVYHDVFTEMNKIRPIYNVIVFFNDDEQTMIGIFLDIFKKLATLKIYGNESIDFSNVFTKGINFIKQYAYARQVNFPGGNFYVRTLLQHSIVNLDISPQRQLDFARRHQEELDNKNELVPLHDAIKRRDKAKVLDLLRSGVKAHKKFFGISLIHFIFPREDSIEISAPDNILDILELLLIYGAEIDSGFNQGTALATIVFQALSCCCSVNNPRQFNTLVQMAYKVIVMDNKISYCNINIDKDQYRNSLEKMIALGQRKLINIKAPQKGRIYPHFFSRVNYQLLDMLIFAPAKRICIFDHFSELTVETIPFNVALENEKLIFELFELFKKNPQWQKLLNKQQMKSYFENTILKSVRGSAFIDVVKQNKEIIAFNIADLIPHQYDGVNYLFHRCILALADPEISVYKGLMFYISHSRGFLPLQNNSIVKVITLFEAASPAPVLAIESFDFYPKMVKLEKLVPLLKNIIYEKDRLEKDSRSNSWRIFDPIASFKQISNPSSWPTRKSFSTKMFFEIEFFKTAASTLVMYENDAYNYYQFKSKLNEYLDFYQNNQESRSIPLSKL